MATKKPKIDKNEPVKVPGGYRYKYGNVLKSLVPEWWMELLCWHQRFPSGLDPLEHLKRAQAILHPGSVWHEWRERRFRSLTDPDYLVRFGATTIRNIAWVGSAASGKTNDAGDFAFDWWIADPERSTVILTSTSKDKIKQRVWPIIQSRWIELKMAMDEAQISGPNMLNSTMMLQAKKGDSKHSIFAQAVERGEVAQAAIRLAGVHCPRIMLVIDEAPGTPQAIFETIANMQKGCDELIVLTSGNGPCTKLDCFSKICRPVQGWNAIHREMEEWKTTGVSEFQLPKGHCLHFSGNTSPNVKAGKTLYPFLYTFENWQRVQADPEYQRTPKCYEQDYGFWTPEGMLLTVLSEEMIERGNARGQVPFDGATIPIGSVDPAFGGDECKLRFGLMGKLHDGRKAVQITESVVVPIQVDMLDKDGKKVPAEYQIAWYVRPRAEQRGVKPHYFGVEATGTGRGVAAVLTQEWGEVIVVESGGKPSDMPASEEDPRPSKEVYDRRITELWFSVQAFVRGKQLGGLSEDDVFQFCARQYVYASKKYSIETKDDLKLRIGRSCDDADSVAVLIEVARRYGMQTIGPRAERMMSMWDREIKLQTAIYQEEGLYQPETAP